MHSFAQPLQRPAPGEQLIEQSRVSNISSVSFVADSYAYRHQTEAEREAALEALAAEAQRLDLGY